MSMHRTVIVRGRIQVKWFDEHPSHKTPASQQKKPGFKPVILSDFTSFKRSNVPCTTMHRAGA